MNKLSVVLVLISSLCLVGCEQMTTANYSNGIPGFPPGHELSVDKKAQA